MTIMMKALFTYYSSINKRPERRYQLPECFIFPRGMALDKRQTYQQKWRKSSHHQGSFEQEVLPFYKPWGRRAGRRGSVGVEKY